MARANRNIQTAEDDVYHVTCRGNNKSEIFHDEKDFLRFLSILEKYHRELAFSLFHYCLMNNHLHLIIKPGSVSTLSAAMQKISLSYSYYYKRRYGFIGQRWQGRFGSERITSDEYLLTCGIYDELNPIRAHIVEKPEDYPWSSFRAYASGEKNYLININPVFLALGSTDQERRAAYRALTKMWQARPPIKEKSTI